MSRNVILRQRILDLQNDAMSVFTLFQNSNTVLNTVT
jgi:hypothetical protein